MNERVVRRRKDATSRRAARQQVFVFFCNLILFTPDRVRYVGHNLLYTIPNIWGNRGTIGTLRLVLLSDSQKHPNLTQQMISSS
jgi:hypothetical protein